VIAFRLAGSVAGVAMLMSLIACTENGLRTFRVLQSQGGIPVAYEAYGLVDPVKGTLHGDAAAREPVWLETADGRHLSVVWPQGFRVRFEPTAVLYDEKEQWLASAGRLIELGQVRWDSAAGTFDDPYYAAGILFAGCYPRAK